MTTACEIHLDYIHGRVKGHADYRPSADYDAMAASLASYQAARVHDVDEKAWLSKRMSDLEAALREIARRESEAREIVTQNRWPSTLAIDLASQARLALETEAVK